MNCVRKNIFGALREVGGKNRKGASKAVEWTNQYGIKRRFTLKKIEEERTSKFGEKKKLGWEENDEVSPTGGNHEKNIRAVRRSHIIHF